MFDSDDDKMKLPMSSNDFDWLVKQLEHWPTRVDPMSTTNIQFLMKNAAQVIKTMSAAGVAGVCKNDSPLIDIARRNLRQINEFFQQKASDAKAIRDSKESNEAWDHLYELTKDSLSGGRVKGWVETTGGVFDYYDPGTSVKDDAMAFISALNSYVQNME